MCFVDEDEDFSEGWIIFELLAYGDTQAIKTLSQIAGPYWRGRR